MNVTYFLQCLMYVFFGNTTNYFFVFLFVCSDLNTATNFFVPLSEVLIFSITGLCPGIVKLPPHPPPHFLYISFQVNGFKVIALCMYNYYYLCLCYCDEEIVSLQSSPKIVHYMVKACAYSPTGLNSNRYCIMRKLMITLVLLCTDNHKTFVLHKINQMNSNN